MISSVTTGRSFRGVLNYCLHDKQELTHEQKLQMEKIDGLKHMNRSEILDYNLCCGNKKELLEQLMDVRNTNPKLSKPVLHVTLSLDPKDKTNDQQLRDIAREYARQFGFDKNQYVTILHNDTQHKHLHIVANRIGFDRKAVSDSHSYKCSAEICRDLERRYELKQVLSPRVYLKEEEKLLPRHDLRKEELQEKIRHCLLQSKNFQDFKNQMEKQKVQVIKGRGISFQDDKKMYVKGSEIGYSIATIEKVLNHSLEFRQQLNNRIELTRQQEQKMSSWSTEKMHKYEMHHILKQTAKHYTPELKQYLKDQQQTILEDRTGKRIMDELMRPGLQQQINNELLKEDNFERSHRQRQYQSMER